MPKTCKCPFFLRKTHSYRFSGLKCKLYMSGRFSLGDGGSFLSTWDKEKRDKKIAEHCHGDYSECTIYQYEMKKGEKQ